MDVRLGGAKGESTARVVLSEGGVAGGIVSEGQGYGLLLAAAAVSMLPADDPARTAAIQHAYAFFGGWRGMCEATKQRRRHVMRRIDAAEDSAKGGDDVPVAHTSCQDDAHLCTWRGDDQTGEPLHAPSPASRCLPSWKFDATLSREVGTGSAPDGDEDALLGQIVLLLATQDSPRPLWWDALAQWAYQSCASFLHHSTTTHPTRRASNGAPLRVLKLGSCWGGFDCSNPSYLAPAHYRVFRDFMTAHAALGDVAGGADHHGDREIQDAASISQAWDALIEGSYMLLGEATCPSTGLVPNWWVPSFGDLQPSDVQRAQAQWTEWEPGAARCSGSGTPAAEFGAEASRTVWRVALDALWFGTPEAIAFCQTIAAPVVDKLLARNASRAGGGAGSGGEGSAEELDVPTSCHGRVEGVHSRWSHVGFMLGPVASALMIPLPADHPRSGAAQQAALDVAAELLERMHVDNYYSGVWITLATLTLTGVLPALQPLLSTLEPESDAEHGGGTEVPMVRILGGLAAFALIMMICRLSGRRGGGSGLFVAAAGSSVIKGMGCAPRAADESEERQPLSEGAGQAEWAIFYDRGGRPYWSDGTRSVWSKPSPATACLAASSPQSSE